MEVLEDCKCWSPADWSHLPLEEFSRKLSEYCRWWCTAVAPDLCPCLPIVLIPQQKSTGKLADDLKSPLAPLNPPTQLRSEAADGSLSKCRSKHQ